MWLSVQRTATNYHIITRNHRTKRTPSSEQASYFSFTFTRNSEYGSGIHLGTASLNFWPNDLTGLAMIQTVFALSRMIWLHRFSLLQSFRWKRCQGGTKIKNLKREKNYFQRCLLHFTSLMLVFRTQKFKFWFVTAKAAEIRIYGQWDD